MATKAYILIETAVGKTRDVVQAVRNIPGMRSVDAVTGPYDVIAVLEADDLNAIGHIVTERVHTVSGVLRTVTCLAVAVR
jgi:DNA-binding Lrp family transcriptional regulator